jgi:hypothetical protein
MSRRRTALALGALAAAALLAGGAPWLLPAPQRAPEAAQPSPPPPWSERAAPEAQASPLEAQWGIRLLGVRRVAAGYALDLRFRVDDPGRAAPLLERRATRRPQLLVEKSGALLEVPWSEKVGTLRQSVRTADQVAAGRHYFVLFANPGRHVEPGDRVTVVIGAFRAEHVPVL